MQDSDTRSIQLNDVELSPVIDNDMLLSLGGVSIAGVRARDDQPRFLPWLDTFEHGVFNRFRLVDIQQTADRATLHTRALADMDYPFRERRDSSGDLCFRNEPWDAPPSESDLRIVFEPAQDEIDGVGFTGFRYWFEYDNADLPIHRLLDRQTWELGGDIEGVTTVCRNWLTPPRVRMGKDVVYSTVGLDDWAGLLPGNMWGRWSLLPGFDLQYSDAGVLLGRFDRMSLIRSALETNAGEPNLRVLDFHWFEQAGSVKTNAKTILFSPTQLDDIDAVNLWTRIEDLEAERVAQQIGLRERKAPAVFFGDNRWVNYDFNTSYRDTIDAAAEFGAEYVFIDSVWKGENAAKEWVAEVATDDDREESSIDTFEFINMCCVMDWEVSDEKGGEAGLKRLCDEAEARGVKLLTWMAAANSPRSKTFLGMKDPDGGRENGFAGTESGRHPWSGYPPSYWPLNLSHPNVWGQWVDKIKGACERTGLAGFLWDSFCNMGWWQVDYPGRTMAPNAEKIAAAYADFANAGLYVIPEAIVTFSHNWALGLHAGNVYGEDFVQMAYGYNCNMALHYKERDQKSNAYCQVTRMLCGERPTDLLFRCIAHKRLPSLSLHRVPVEEQDKQAAEAIKQMIADYKAHRDRMQRRTVLHDDAGVVWENDAGEPVFFCLRDLDASELGDGTSDFVDGSTGQAVSDGRLQANRVYQFKGQFTDTFAKATASSR